MQKLKKNLINKWLNVLEADLVARAVARAVAGAAGGPRAALAWVDLVSAQSMFCANSAVVADAGEL